jgi:hypothetical protein
MPYFNNFARTRQFELAKKEGFITVKANGPIPEDYIKEKRREFRLARREQKRQDTPLVSKLEELAQAERLVEVERLAGKFKVSGDFAGCVNGEWQGLTDEGAGIVRYDDKEYKTENIGFVSNACGERVQLCFAQGKYFASY